MAYVRYQRSVPYKPGQATPYKISRSKIDLFMQCPRCFWLDGRLKISRPKFPPFRLNTAVDELLKTEFDTLRKDGKQHPLQIEYGIDAKPISHDKLNVWRENFKGVETLHRPTNLLITGAIDDLWQGGDGKYIVVDYKSTSKNGRIEALDDSQWNDQYRRQLEVYQWLLRQNGLEVSDTGYWVYCNAMSGKAGFDKKLEFEITLISYKGSDKWINPTLLEIKKTLNSDDIPKESATCEYCNYARARTELTLNSIQKRKASKTELV